MVEWYGVERAATEVVFIRGWLEAEEALPFRRFVAIIVVARRVRGYAAELRVRRRRPDIGGSLLGRPTGCFGTVNAE